MSDINALSCPPEITEEDILSTMRSMEGYIDITPSDFREFYIKAYKHARERLLLGVTAGQIMTKEVHSICSESNISLAADLMAKEKVSGLPVLNNNNELIGIISEKDLIKSVIKDAPPSLMSVIARCLSNKGCLALSLRKLKVVDLMTAPAIAVFENTPLSEIIILLNKGGINRLPVKDKNNRVVGIITRSDIIKAIFNTTCTIDKV
jgi:CBS domain-containing membrane protein